MPQLTILVVSAEQWPHICVEEPPARLGPSRTRSKARCRASGCRPPSNVKRNVNLPLKIMDLKRNVFTGVVTLIPVLMTVFVFSIFLDLLSDIGRPKVVVLANAIRPVAPQVASWLLDVPWLSSVLAILLTLGMFYLIGWSMSRFFGRRLFAAIEHGVKRIPVVTTVYGATKKLIDSLRTDSGSARKVVLIAFPHARMKAVGLVTRSFVDEETGVELAAVYVPTAPNPAGGYLEIVPAAELVPLDWTVDEAMTFVLSGGTVAPERIRFSRPQSDSDSSRSGENVAGPENRNIGVAPPNKEPASSQPFESGAIGGSIDEVGHIETPAQR